MNTVVTIHLLERIVHKIKAQYKKGENALARQPNLTGAMQLEEINGGVGTNGDEEEDLMTEQTQMKYKNGWDSLVEQHAEEEKRYNMKWVV